MSDSVMWETLLKTGFAALFTLVGYAGSEVHKTWKERQQAEVTTQRSLQELDALLEESRSIYVAQQYQARRLLEMLSSRVPDGVTDGAGYDDVFYRMHDQLTHDERELREIIRSTTMNSMRRVNHELSDWLRAHSVFKATNQPTAARNALAKALRTLELHLNQWHDKYEATMPHEPRRSLVYLVDEKRHGTGFPTGIEALLGQVLREDSAPGRDN